jgi:hypothetical protein
MTHHLAHHLRPTAQRSELPRLEATVVAAVVAASGLPEVVYPSFLSAVRHHYVRLRELGRPTSQPDACSEDARARSGRALGEPLTAS